MKIDSLTHTCVRSRPSVSSRFLRVGARGLAFAVLLAALGAASWIRFAGAEPPKLAPSLAHIVETQPDASVIAWVYFTDRAGAERDPEAFGRLHAVVSQRSLERRARRGLVTGLVASDLPVHPSYVRALVARGVRVRGTSRWLNAASIEARASLAAEIARLPFVARMELVPVGLRMRPVDAVEASEAATSASASGGAAAGASTAPNASATFAPGDTAYYGGSFRQLAMMQVPQLHASGLTGAGVLVCMLDTGFRTTHQIFAGLNVVAKRDFIFGDTNVDYDPTQDSPSQHTHGTWTLGCVAGSKPGVYSGPAFGASVALAKTEYVPTERPVEMDYWQFGAEWADSLGADVISSSLGYSVFDTLLSYTPADMDGRTTVVARAAIEAARRGITVVNSAGNEGGSSWGKIISPADADSIISVGAVDSFNVVTSFSSRGPTADGRIKPDVTAMGQSVLLANSVNDTLYTRASGTSFSCPLTSGVVALLLQANPSWGPIDVRSALHATALNHAAPNTVIGWGLVQGLAARAWIPSTLAVPHAGDGSGLSLAAGPNPLRAGGELSIRFGAPAGSHVTLEVLDLAGRREARLHEGPGGDQASVNWDGRNRAGVPLAAGVYWVRVSAVSPHGSLSRSVRVALVP